jgi:hypothetical protein
MSLQEVVNDPYVSVTLTPKGGYMGDQVTIEIFNGRPECILVMIERGTILIPTNFDEQKLVISKSLDVELREGESITLHGLWVFCITAAGSVPSPERRMDVGPHLRELRANAAAHLQQLLAHLEATGLLDDGDAQAAVWAISDATPVEENSRAAGILCRAGIDTAELDEPLPVLTSPFMLDDVVFPSFSTTIPLDQAIDPALIERLLLQPCESCTRCDFESLPGSFHGGLLALCDLVFIGSNLGGPNLSVTPTHSGGVSQALWMSNGTLDIAFPEGTSCVQITYWHEASGGFSAYDAMGLPVAARPFGVAEGIVLTAVLRAEEIRFVVADGAELTILSICYR